MSKEEGTGSALLSEYKKERNKLIRKMDALDEDDNVEYTDEYADCHTNLLEYQEAIVALEKEKLEMAAKLKSKREQKSKKSKIIEDCKRERKTDSDSLYSAIDKILQDYGILRAAYHGGDLTGGCVKKLMANAEIIMERVEALLIENKDNECTLDNAQIHTLCNNSAQVLSLWDGALAEMHTNYPLEENCRKTQQYIDKAMKVSREMEMSVIVKEHGTEKHIVSQMRNTRGGLFEFDESWGEQYHQVGHSFDVRLNNQGCELRKGIVRAGENRRVTHPKTQLALKKVVEKKRGKRPATLAKEADVKKMKTERRSKYL